MRYTEHGRHGEGWYDFGGIKYGTSHGEVNHYLFQSEWEQFVSQLIGEEVNE